MPSHRLAIATALAALGVSAAIACGPMFPTQLLTRRAETLRTAPVNSFVFEAMRLATPSDALKAREIEYVWAAAPDRDVKNRAAAETDGLTPAQADAIARMRGAASGDVAFQGGATLPPAVRLYTAGAVDFARGAAAGAARRFAAVLQLPDAERTSRATWAAFMLGRARALDNDIAGAAQAFALTRQFALAGMPDPLGLAVASYGEEARLHLPVQDEPPRPDPEHARALARAVALYAEQAARESVGGTASLRIVAERLMREPERLPAVVKEPLIQRLLVVYVLARVQDPAMALSEYSDFEVAEIDSSNRNHPPDPLERLVDAIEQAGVDAPAGADRLAALAYYTARYDLAQRLVERADGPLAAWIGAKLALQRGNLARAADLYAAAARAFPAADATGPIDADNRRLLVGERGVLQLARGDYVAALDHLYQARYWGDVAHIAERVLDVDALKRFVDTTPALPNPEPEDRGYWGNDEAPGDITARLRHLLARRLMREHRFADAFDYFAKPEHRAEAEVYADAHHDAATRWSRIERARAWFDAALLAREAGMDILAYETGPDYAVRGGAYDTGLGQDALDADDPFVTPAERARFAATAPQPERRYHYRYLAVDQVLQAAALLPPRSQAYAAVLCHATGWMLHTRDAGGIAQSLYRLYLTRGPYVPWAKDFGRDCPEPDFDGASRLLRSQPLAAVRHAVRRNLPWLGPSLVVVALAGVWLVRRRRAG